MDENWYFMNELLKYYPSDPRYSRPKRKSCKWRVEIDLEGRRDTRSRRCSPSIPSNSGRNRRPATDTDAPFSPARRCAGRPKPTPKRPAASWLLGRAVAKPPPPSKKQTKQLDRTNKKKGTRKLDTCLVLGCCCCFVVAAEFKPSPTNHRPVRTETEKNNNNDNDGLGRRDATEPTTSPVLGFLRDFRGCPSLPTRPPNHPTTQPPTHPPGSPPLQPPASHAGGSLLFFFLLPPIFFSSGAPHWPAERQSSPEAIGFFFVFFFRKYYFSLSLCFGLFRKRWVSLLASQFFYRLQFNRFSESDASCFPSFLFYFWFRFLGFDDLGRCVCHHLTMVLMVFLLELDFIGQFWGLFHPPLEALIQLDYSHWTTLFTQLRVDRFFYGSNWIWSTFFRFPCFRVPVPNSFEWISSTGQFFFLLINFVFPVSVASTRVVHFQVSLTWFDRSLWQDFSIF